jgi:hypothetical protein
VPIVVNSGRVPDFLGIGAQRSGTTWLHRNLSRHRDLWLVPAPLKEIHYFNEVHCAGHDDRHVFRSARIDKFIANRQERGTLKPETLETLTWLRANERNDDWYRRLFTLSPVDKLCGEITPAYSLLPPAGIEHMLALNPDLRLFFMMRHPIERAWSQVRFTVGRTDLLDNPDAPVAPERLRTLLHKGGNLDRTDYPDIINRYRDKVASDHLLLAYFDQVVDDPIGLLADVAVFLGVDPKRYNDEKLTPDTKHNSSPAIPMPPDLAHELAERYGAQVQWLQDNVGGVPDSWMDKVERHANA